ncbi:DNA topoisomerase IV [Neotamlana laminarinivorans]|uniref:DNA topoisomerase IV n=1 Tax=Neotamlana laminarinivorans TaxID=2883124 RepID=A0A9X1HXK8_9FLAO|nr:DNA topoisomerase IV [Tamlana laminarinivorans]MCB4797641.1 DNA topoisomerase IV [Tamlana laminarinivorans]
MKSIIWGLFFCFFGCYTTTRNCKDFKTGKFYSEVIINDELYKSTFNRAKNIQVETYNGKKDSSSLRWINDCEVIFKTINPKNRAERKDIHLKILTTTDSSYTFEYSYVGETKKQKGIAYKIN